VQKFILEVNLF